jgi:hypothetical protein
MNSFRTLVLQLRIFAPCAAELQVGTSRPPETRRLEPVSLLDDAGIPA